MLMIPILMIGILRRITSNIMIINFAWVVFICLEQTWMTYKCMWRDFCNIVMPSEDTKRLEFNGYCKSDKAPFSNYAELKPLIEKIDGFLKNPEKLSTTKVSEHIPPGFQCLQYYHLNI